jgi:hypothetical protein
VGALTKKLQELFRGVGNGCSGLLGEVLLTSLVNVRGLLCIAAGLIVGGMQSAEAAQLPAPGRYIEQVESIAGWSGDAGPRIVSDSSKAWPQIVSSLSQFLVTLPDQTGPVAKEGSKHDPSEPREYWEQGLQLVRSEVARVWHWWLTFYAVYPLLALSLLALIAGAVVGFSCEQCTPWPRRAIPVRKLGESTEVKHAASR